MKNIILILSIGAGLMACQSQPVSETSESALQAAEPAEQEPLAGYPVPVEELKLPTQSEWENSFLSEIEAIEVFQPDEFKELENGNKDVYAVLYSNEGADKRNIAGFDPCARRGYWATFFAPGPESGRGCYIKGTWHRCSWAEKAWSKGMCYRKRRNGSMGWATCNKKGIAKNQHLTQRCPVTGKSWWQNVTGGSRPQRQASPSGRGCMLKGKWFYCSYLNKMWAGRRCYRHNSKGQMIWAMNSSTTCINQNKGYTKQCNDNETRKACRQRLYVPPKRVPTAPRSFWNGKVSK
ncbi:MAG: hypothetical protein KDD33_13005 [Bdellovibrionales bacterium]|nr:hypothetical protein [Bdellovibrionales bacterium]